MSKSNKNILLIFIILLIIFVPTAILSVYLKFNYDEHEEKIVDEQISNNETTLVGNYVCQSSSCSYATSYIDDANYAIDYLQTAEQEINVYNDKYAFIADNDMVYLYDIINDEIIETYQHVKNYNNMLSSNYVIVQDFDDKWGVIQLSDEVSTIIIPIYDFIGVINDVNESLLSTELFVVKNSSIWALLDEEGDLISNYVSYEIVSFNSQVISVKGNDVYYLYDYNGRRVVNDSGFNYISFANDYINIVTLDNQLYVYDYLTDNNISDTFTLYSDDYQNSFSSYYDEGTDTLTLSVNGSTYTYNL